MANPCVGDQHFCLLNHGKELLLKSLIYSKTDRAELSTGLSSFLGRLRAHIL